MSAKKLRKIFFVICAVALAVIMGVEGPTQVMAFALEPDAYFEKTPVEQLESEIKNGKINGQFPSGTKFYVSELMMGTGNSAAEAKKALHDKGYLVYDQNMNEGTDTGKYAYLGYKITTDRTKAITDLKVMDERGGYEAFEYLDFAGKSFPELDALLANMRKACEELKQLAEAGNPSSVAAMEYLNLFTVTYKESEEKELTDAEKNAMQYIPDEDEKPEPEISQKLGEYLITNIDKRSDRSLKILELCTNPYMLNIINSQIASGLNISKMRPVDCDCGEKSEGVTNGVFTSQNGVVGYNELVSNPDWIKNAVDKMLKDNNLSSVNDTKSLYWANIQKNNGTQADIFDDAVKNNTLSEEAEKYLKGIVLETDKSTLAEICKTNSSVTAYDFLTKAPVRYKYAFFENVPEVCKGYYFVDVLEICATDYLNRIPNELVIEQYYDNNIMDGMVNKIKINIDLLNSESARKAKADDIENHRTDIDRFAVALSQFFDDYLPIKERYDKNGGVVDNSGDNGASEEIKPDDLYYLGAYNFLASFEVRDGLNLAEYLQEAYTQYKNDNTSYAFALLYPVVTSLSAGQTFIYKSNGLIAMFLNISMANNQVLDCRNSIPSLIFDLEEGFGSEVFSIWEGGNRRFVSADEKAFFTSDKARRAAENSNYQSLFPSEITLSQKLKKAYEITGGVALATAGVAAVAGGVVLTIMWTTTATAVAGMTALAGVAIVLSIVAVAAIAAAIIIALACLAVFIAYLCSSTEKAPEQYTIMPTILIEDVTNEKLDASNLAEYYLVRNQNGKYADVNCFKGMKWSAIYYTKSTAVGSPLTLGVNGSENSFFAHSIGNDNGPDTAYPLCKFGQVNTYNLNSNCLDDECNGIYFYFFTENSLKKIPFNTKTKGKYIDNVSIAYAENTATGNDAARSYIKSLERFYLIDVNLSPDAEFCTYFGYSTTNEPNRALTDIRVSYGSVSNEITYGNVKYFNVTPSVSGKYFSPAKTCNDNEANREDTDFSYAVFGAIDKLAGSPILSDEIGVVSNISDVKDGYETIQVFSGGHFDFNAWDGEGYDTFSKHKFIYFSPEKKYKSTDADAKQYVSGFAFYSGSEDWLSESDTSEYNLENFAKLSAGGHLISKPSRNITPGLLYNDEDATYLAYFLTYNPKRAITEIGSFTGEAKYGKLADNITSAGIGYEVCQVYTQGDGHYYGSGSRQRLVRKSHAYLTCIEDEINGCNWNDSTFVFPRGLYVAGPQANVKPLTTEDIVVSYKKSIPGFSDYFDSSAFYYLPNANTTDSIDEPLQPTGWKSVHPLDEYYYDSYDKNGILNSLYNLGLGTRAGTYATGTENLYIFYNNGTPDRVRGNYISSVDIVGSIDADCSLDMARYAAMGSHTDILNLDKPMSFTNVGITEVSNECPIRYRHEKEEFTDYNDGFYFIAVSYSDYEINSVGYLRVIKREYGKSVPDYMELPLSQNTVKTGFNKGNFAEIPYDSDSKGDMPGYAIYTANNHWGINRLEIKELALAPMSKENTYWGTNPNGEAEYYVPIGSEYEPFVFENRVNNIGYCIAIKRQEAGSDMSDLSSAKKYIKSINVVTDVSYDGTVHRAAASLGAKNYPYAVDFDISEGRIEGTNKVIALAVTRTDDVEQAIKDVRISSVDLGEKINYDNLIYYRQNAVSATKEIPNTEDVFIYATYGKEEKLINWSDVDYENTNWETFDWYHLDFSTTADTESWDKVYNHTISQDLIARIEEIVGIKKQQSEKYEADWYKWAEKYAITNLGFKPSADSALLNERKEAGLDTQYFWAGATADYNTRLLTPVTSSTTVLSAQTFDGSVSSFGIVYTNNAAKIMDTVDDNTVTLQASVFADNPALVMLIIFTAVSALAIIGVVLYKKKKLVFAGKQQEENE